MSTKVCKQCGALKPLGQFRKYYGGRKGNYGACKSCEKINSREKYLAAKESQGTMTELEQNEMAKIYALWHAQIVLGLRPPRFGGGKSTPLADELDDMLSVYTERASAVQGLVQDNTATPAELVKWLTEELTEMLQSIYRPQLNINTETMLPVYDDKYRAILQKVLARFDEYEDGYYN
jgi:hypothetical protein